mgnify:CR=1 FL=1
MLQQACPDQQVAILESRDAMGGTWDLFRYPGIRSDSDMHTMGYGFRPWTDASAIADGASILRYVQETARERGLDYLIRYQHRVICADWSERDARWLVTVEVGEKKQRKLLRCTMLHMCAGYYRYDRAHRPVFAGEEDFEGTIIHPQFWPEGLDHAGKRVVVIGSGATAVTLVPELARTAAQVTMLQRSPSYVISLPAQDKLAQRLKSVLPPALSYRLVRAKNIALNMLFFKLCRRWPEALSARLVRLAARQLGSIEMARHFSASYKPWDQRLCIAPDGDLFRALRGGKASVVTGQIERFTQDGVRLESGEALSADIIVTATGLEMSLIGGVKLSLDGQAVKLSEAMA